MNFSERSGLIEIPPLVCDCELWRFRPGGDSVTGCCLSKSAAEYTKIVAANSTKTAAHVCKSGPVYLGVTSIQ